MAGGHPSHLRQPIPFLIRTHTSNTHFPKCGGHSRGGGGLYQGLCVTKKDADPTLSPPPFTYSILVTFLEYAKRRRRRNHSIGLASAKSCWGTGREPRWPSMVQLRFLNEKRDPLNERARKLIWGLQCKHPRCSRVLLLARTTPSRIHKFALDVREKTLGSRSLLNLISHNLPPLKSSASTRRRLTTPESTVESESTNNSYRINSDAPMPPGLTLSVLLSSIRKPGSTVPCPNRKQRSMRSSPPDFTLRSAPVVTQHATKKSWCTATRILSGVRQGHNAKLEAPRTTINLALVMGNGVH